MLITSIKPHYSLHLSASRNGRGCPSPDAQQIVSTSQHVRPPGFCCRWPDGLELFSG